LVTFFFQEKKVTEYYIAAMNNNWQLIWSDEFDNEGLPDPRKWDYEISGPLQTEAFELFQQYTASRLENARCENGLLVIEARKELFENSSYTSASLFSKTAWRYCKIEVRAKFAKGRGIWPAIWMLPQGFNGEGWPECGEIDIIEHLGQKPNDIFFNVNTAAYNIMDGTAKGMHSFCESLYEKFHVYTIEWTEQNIQFFMDDVLMFDFIKENPEDAYWPFDKPFYLKLMLGVGLLYDFNDGIKEVDDSVFPQQMLIDYVKVYKPV
jgi:beta-glucanase (GH16 family)